MKAKLYSLLILFLATINTSLAFQEGQDHKILFEKAVYSMETKADLKEAIILFDSLIRTYPDERAYAANAQFHIGLCYEKLGNQEAKKAYQEVIQNYEDQKEVVQIARERLSWLILMAEKIVTPPVTPKFTKIKIPTEISWDMHLSPDGKKVSLVSDKKLWILPLYGKLGTDIPGAPLELNTQGVRVEWTAHTWSGDGNWIAFNEYPLKELTKDENKGNQGIYVVSSKGGSPKKVYENYRDARTVNYRISLSSDGKTLAFSDVDLERNEQHIYTISVDGGIPKQLVDAQAREPVFSPDGKMIAFVEDRHIGRGGGDLWVVPARGGTPILVLNAKNASSPIWSPEGDMIAFLDYGNKGNQINFIPMGENGEATGDLITIDTPEGIDGIWLLAGWSHDNKIGAIFERRGETGLYTLPVKGGKAVQVAQGGGQPRWSPDGKRIFCVNFSNERSGAWQRLAIASIPVEGGNFMTVPIQTDVKIYIPYFGVGNRVSPDGKMIVFSAKTQKEPPHFLHNHIWTLLVEGGMPNQLTEASEQTTDMFPCWSPDGKAIAFVRAIIKTLTNIKTNILIVQENGGEPTSLTTESDSVIFGPIEWSPDGKFIAYFSQQGDTSSSVNLKIISANGDGKSRVIGKVKDPHPGMQFAWSPDSKRIAFNGPEGKVIKIISLEDGSKVNIETGLVDSNIGDRLDWSPDGERFVFVGGKGEDKEFWLMEDFLPLEKLPQKKEKESFVIHKVLDGTEAGFDGGIPSPDGKYFAFTDWSTGNLAIYERATGKKRSLTKQGSWESDHVQYVENSTWSPDGKRIVYDWQNENGYIELRLIGLDDSKPRILYKPNEEVIWVETFDWSADGKQILACFQRKDHTRQIVLVSAGDGSVRILKTLVGKSWTDNMSFSPDGRYIVYDYPTEEYSQDRDIYLMSTNGDHEISLIEHPAYDKVLGWAPDGKNILFASDRTGTFAAFVIQVAEGKPQGIPKLIKSDIGNLSPRGFTQKGSFYYTTSKEGNNVYTVDLDHETGKILTPPKKAIKRFEGSNHYPYYSPDGKYLAYISVHNRQGIICIHNLETGKDREINLSRFNIKGARGFRWSPDCSSILAMGTDNKYRHGIIQIHVQTGNVTPIVPWENWKSTFMHSGEWSLDGKTIFYVDFNTTNNWSKNNLSQIMVWDLDTGAEKELYRFDNYTNISLSPDEKWLASSHPLSLKVMPVTGGEPRELYRFEEESGNERPITWSADGKYILFSKKEPGQDGWDLCRIPVDGGEPQKLELKIENRFANLSAHPNGRKIAFSFTEQTNTEFWVMENFLPEIKAEQ